MSTELIMMKESSVVALIDGNPVIDLPKDLYIPPEALEVFLETFQGPLDLLLYLIKKQNLDILNIPIAEITRQYMTYMNLMKTLHLELAAEYLVMAALLAEIKSRLLLPRPIEKENNEEIDPRAELIRRLQEYEQIKIAAENLAVLPQLGRDFFYAGVQVSEAEVPRPQPQLDLKKLLEALKEVMQRASLYTKHAIQRESLSIRERMSSILSYVKPDVYIDFHQLFIIEEGKMGVVVTFIAILELLKQSLIEISQDEPFAPLQVKAMLG